MKMNSQVEEDSSPTTFKTNIDQMKEIVKRCELKFFDDNFKSTEALMALLQTHPFLGIAQK